MRSSRALTAAVVVALVALVGSMLVAVVADPPDQFGWFAYSPLTEGDLVGGVGDALLLVSRVQAVAAAVAAVALAATTGLLGYALGRRRAPSSSCEVSGPPR
ncbi:hypothetical protein FHN55_14815 [Streptomyces sp. NP160]|uniref:hypothetical protein n=1 Tax=Streptomyces sp. NP160 TaxID=2586637 RepID=UPI001118E036|nr:hypothetical protein [Streptomyces sp. NP160]TNM64101.1 hypothetical protein FHN55_14815 [Streptomyces sp. NP160]